MNDSAKKISISSLIITDFKEETNHRYHSFSFRIGQAQYRLILTSFQTEQDVFYKKEVRHQNQKCLFCSKKLREHASFCKALTPYEEELFRRLVRYSKNRLRWLMVTTE